MKSPDCEHGGVIERREHIILRLMPSLQWRPMLRSDLARAEAIAEQVHPDLPEDPQVFAERLRLFPTGCFMLDNVGYAIGHPWTLDRLPKLNTLLGSLSAEADTFFIHDVALLQPVRGRGFAGAVVRLFAERARTARVSTMSLIATETAAGFWRHHGFVPIETLSAADALASYGAGARAMVRQL